MLHASVDDVGRPGPKQKCVSEIYANYTVVKSPKRKREIKLK